jgi:hypothetical protein
MTIGMTMQASPTKPSIILLYLFMITSIRGESRRSLSLFPRYRPGRACGGAL